jgi:hypothetical protein
MRSLISEFSYGFALTHELVSALGSLSAAPVFPSLIEEGRAGGGYDVKLEAPGVPLFLQFKRSDCLSRRSAREIRGGAPLTTPYYRIEITAKADSEQHEMLIDLDQPPNLVFYAAPMFHQKSEFDTAFLSGTVRQQSFFVSPKTIGHFADAGAHHLSFDGSHCVIMSEPKSIEGLGAVELEALLRERLERDKRPLRATVDEAVQEAQAARTRTRERHRRHEEEDRETRHPPAIAMTEKPQVISAADDFRRRQAAALPRAEAPKMPDDPGEAALQRLADIGLREFNAQLYIVQAKDEG